MRSKEEFVKKEGKTFDEIIGKYCNDVFDESDLGYVLNEDSITFDNFCKCGDNQVIVKLPKEFKCMCCDTSSKDFNLSEDETAILARIISRGHFVIPASESELPLIKVLMDRQDYYNNRRHAINGSDPLGDAFKKKPSITMFEQFLGKNREKLDLCRDLGTARMCDREGYAAHIPDDVKEIRLSQLDSELNEALSGDTRFRDLIIEEYKTARYEVLIMNGIRIATLLLSAKTEEDKDALAKACFNLTNLEYKVNSEYFGHDIFYSLVHNYLTANQDINERILRMRLR